MLNIYIVHVIHWMDEWRELVKPSNIFNLLFPDLRAGGIQFVMQKHRLKLRSI